MKIRMRAPVRGLRFIRRGHGDQGDTVRPIAPPSVQFLEVEVIDPSVTEPRHYVEVLRSLTPDERARLKGTKQ